MTPGKYSLIGSAAFLVVLAAVVLGLHSSGALAQSTSGGCRWEVEGDDVAQFPSQVLEGTLISSRECTIDIPPPVPPGTMVRLCTDLNGARERFWNVAGNIIRQPCAEYPVVSPGKLDFTLEGLVPRGFSIYTGQGQQVVLHQPQDFDIVVVGIVFAGEAAQEVLNDSSQAITQRYQSTQDTWNSIRDLTPPDLVQAIEEQLQRGFLDQVDTMLASVEIIIRLESEMAETQGRLEKELTDTSMESDRTLVATRERLEKELADTAARMQAELRDRDTAIDSLQDKVADMESRLGTSEADASAEEDRLQGTISFWKRLVVGLGVAIVVAAIVAFLLGGWVTSRQLRTTED